MEVRSISRELALLLLGQISESNIPELDLLSIEKILNKALDTLMDHWREELNTCAAQIEMAQDQLRDSEFKDINKNSNDIVRDHLKNCFSKGENIINSLSETIELTRLLSLSDQVKIRNSAIDRVSLVTKDFKLIDSSLDNVMEGWRLKRLPRIDRDILRLAFVELKSLNIPIAVACNEAVNLANRYSDETGRRMINGILRRIQNDSSITFAQ
tara:strand:+ start:413 stop:1051 length:639 start_codon:yes stop_codon:yes gene_type:complete